MPGTLAYVALLKNRNCKSIIAPVFIFNVAVVHFSRCAILFHLIKFVAGML